MDISVLRDFAVLAESSNFTKAAELVHTSQPNLSKRMAALERELGFKLLQRDTRSVSLTQSGQKFYQIVVDMLSRFDAGVEQAQAMDANMPPLVSVGGNFANPKILTLVENAAGYAKKAQLPLQITIDRAFMITDVLMPGYIEAFDCIKENLDDVVVTFSCRDLTTLSDKVLVPLYRDSFAIFLPADAGYTEGQEVPLSALESFTFIRPVAYETYNNRIHEVCEELGIHPQYRTVYYDSMGDMVQGIDAGELMIVPESVAFRFPDAKISGMVRVRPTDRNAAFEIVAVYTRTDEKHDDACAKCCSVLKTLAQEA